jgi:DNA replication protein DnaC
LKHPGDLAHERIYDRVLERCVPLRINNQNIRELNRAANFAQTKAILTGSKANKPE